jgi:hypothetical protein
MYTVEEVIPQKELKKLTQKRGKKCRKSDKQLTPTKHIGWS